MDIQTKELNITKFKQLRWSKDIIRYIIIHHTAWSYKGDKSILLGYSWRKVSVH